MTRRATNSAGFTLLEILVALVVLGFLLAGLSQGVRFGLRAWDSESRLVDRRTDMDAMERVLRGVIAEADPGDVNEPAPFRGETGRLDLVTRLPGGAAGLPTGDAEVGLGVDAQHRFVLRWRASPHAERLGPPPPLQQSVLLEGVDGVAFAYLRRPEQGGGWSETWHDLSLPALVRITVDFPKDDRRHWPAIVAAPMLGRQLP